jgi:hypothetical protein
MAFSEEQKQVLREMIQRKFGDADYSAKLAKDDVFALSEIQVYKQVRLNEIAVDQELIDKAVKLYQSV